MIKRILEIQALIGGYLPCQLFLAPFTHSRSADDPRFQRIFITQPGQCEMCDEDMEMRIELTIHQVASLIAALQELGSTLDQRLDERGNQ